MFKKYNPRLLSSYRSYKLRDICRLYKDKKLHDKTVRTWIKTGKLEAFKDGNTILVYGAVLKQYFTDQNNKHKRTLKFNQFRCGKCKKIDTPLDKIITKLTTGKNGCILAFGNCGACGHNMNRPYKRREEQQILEYFKIEDNALARIYGSSCGTGKTHLEIEPKHAASESLDQSDILSDAVNKSTASNIAPYNKQMSIFDLL